MAKFHHIQSLLRRLVKSAPGDHGVLQRRVLVGEAAPSDRVAVDGLHLGHVRRVVGQELPDGLLAPRVPGLWPILRNRFGRNLRFKHKRVAKFLLLPNTKTGINIPNHHELYQMSKKYNKRP
jgi:hypothetical protein